MAQLDNKPITMGEASIHYAVFEMELGAGPSDSFVAGAKWQKEQSKELINLMRQLLAAYDFRYPDAKQLLAGYTNPKAFEKMNNLIEQLQD